MAESLIKFEIPGSTLLSKSPLFKELTVNLAWLGERGMVPEDWLQNKAEAQAKIAELASKFPFESEEAQVRQTGQFIC